MHIKVAADLLFCLILIIMLSYHCALYLKIKDSPFGQSQTRSMLDYGYSLIVFYFIHLVLLLVIQAWEYYDLYQTKVAFNDGYSKGVHQNAAKGNDLGYDKDANKEIIPDMYDNDIIAPKEIFHALK